MAAQDCRTRTLASLKAALKSASSVSGSGRHATGSMSW
jgi:hypothetical protein